MIFVLRNSIYSFDISIEIVLLIVHYLFVIHLINEYLGHENKFTEKGWWHVRRNSLRYMDMNEIFLRNRFYEC